jgi:hypothetical protein
MTRRRVCSFQFLPGIANAGFLRPESHRTHEHILSCLFLRLPNLEGHVPVFVSPRNRVAQLYPRALGRPLWKKLKCTRKRRKSKRTPIKRGLCSFCSHTALDRDGIVLHTFIALVLVVCHESICYCTFDCSQNQLCTVFLFVFVLKISFKFKSCRR